LLYVIINKYHLTVNQFYTVFKKSCDFWNILHTYSEIIAYFIALSMASVSLCKQT